MKKKLFYSFFFSNYFYGFCAVALSIEATLQERFPFNSPFYYLFIFSVTVLYYTRAYITEKRSNTANPRSLWYYEHRKAILVSQLMLTVVAASFAIKILVSHSSSLLSMSMYTWILLLIFPSVAALYYGINHRRFAGYKLRNIGWLKPFIIGFVWAGLVTIYPVLFYNIENAEHYQHDLIGLFLFIKNFMFVTVLCIMFDIKDYAADHNKQLKTFVVKTGLRNTIFFILIPLCIAGLASFVYYGMLRHFTWQKIAMNIIPFLLLLLVAYSLHKRKHIIYYLVVIDGLMLVKAICGTVAMIYF